MADDCCASACGSTKSLNDPRWRRALWIALALNASMFIVEFVAGESGTLIYALNGCQKFADGLNFI